MPTLLLMEPPLVGDDDREGPPESGAGMVAVVERGHRDGSVDPALDPGWIEVFMWITLAAGQLQARRPDVAERAALDLVVEAVLRAIGPSVTVS